MFDNFYNQPQPQQQQIEVDEPTFMFYFSRVDIARNNLNDFIMEIETRVNQEVTLVEKIQEQILIFLVEQAKRDIQREIGYSYEQLRTAWDNGNYSYEY